MKTRMLLGIGVIAVLAIIIAQVLIFGHPSAHKTEPLQTELTKSKAPTTATINVTVPEKGPLKATTGSRQDTSVSPVPRTKAQTNTPPQNETADNGKPIMYNGYQPDDPLARVALYFVGSGDPEANAYWENAIFDPTLPAEERKDLIEDLNETGMADPQHPSPEDLPLILARIRLIEQLAPYSIDQVDANAFGEAYKDLVGMANGQAPQ